MGAGNDRFRGAAAGFLPVDAEGGPGATPCPLAAAATYCWTAARGLTAW